MKRLSIQEAGVDSTSTTAAKTKMLEGAYLTEPAKKLAARLFKVEGTLYSLDYEALGLDAKEGKKLAKTLQKAQSDLLKAVRAYTEFWQKRS